MHAPFSYKSCTSGLTVAVSYHLFTRPLHAHVPSTPFLHQASCHQKAFTLGKLARDGTELGWHVFKNKSGGPRLSMHVTKVIPLIWNNSRDFICLQQKWKWWYWGFHSAITKHCVLGRECKWVLAVHVCLSWTIRPKHDLLSFFYLDVGPFLTGTGFWICSIYILLWIITFCFSV